jgi:multidrug efflux pump subunit AcrB
MKSGNTSLTLFAVAAATLLGLILARTIPSAVFPEITFNRAIILANSGDLPAAQMLVGVTRPIEEVAYGVQGVSLVTSTTTRGSSEIDVTFSERADPTSAYQLLNAALGEVRAHLPPETEVNTRLLTTGTFPIVEVSMSSPTRDLAAITDLAFYEVVPSFHRIAGVYRVEIVGGKYREFVVKLNPAALMAHQLTAQDVVDGLRKANVIQSAGRIIDSHRMLLTVVTTDIHEAEQLAGLPIGSQDNQPVYVRDVGEVHLAIREDYIRTASQNGPAVLVEISRQADGNTVAIATEVRSLVARFAQRHPDVKFSLSYDQSALVTESFNSVRDAIVLGLVLAVAVVLVCTFSVLNAAIAAIVVPCTIAITCVVMKGTGLTFNMMTLGGLAAGIGLFIDDAIVMIESIHRYRTAGETPDKAVIRAVGALQRALIASTLTVIVVFMPLIFMSGISGMFFRALAATLGAGLAISLLLALYFTPALEVMVAPWRRPAREERFFALLGEVVIWTVKPLTRFPAVALLLTAACIAGAVVLYGHIGTDYLPALDEGEFVLDYYTPPQSTIAETQALLARIEEILRSTPEIASFSVRTGTQLGFFLTESNRGDMSVRLRANRQRGIDAIINEVRERILASVPGVRIEFSQELQDLLGDLSGTPEPIEVKVFGSQQDVIEATANRVADLMRGIPGLVDISNGIVLSNPEEEMLINPTAAQRYGLSAQNVADALRVVVEGTIATQLRVNDRLYGVRVRYPDRFHENLSAMGGVLLQSPGHGTVPLSSLITMRWLGEQPELDRERLRPLARVTARLASRDLGSAVAQVERHLAKIIPPAGITFEIGGLYAQQAKAFGELELVLIAGTIGMFLIVVWEFRRTSPAVAVLLGSLASLAGSMAALELSGITLNISSFMGTIMVVGIAAKNGILLLDHAEHEVLNGKPPEAAVLNAIRVRIRPITMTTLATAAGLLPLALGMGAGAKIQQPLAVAVIGGLVLAILVTNPIAGGVYLLARRGRRDEA